MPVSECPICLETTKLVKHHWFEKKNSLKHSEYICPSCNSALRTMVGEPDHTLPSWDAQIAHVKSRLVKHPRGGRNYKTILINKELADRIKVAILENNNYIFPMSTIFTTLGYCKIQGVTYSLLQGAVSMVAIELGFEVVKLGTIWVIKKPFGSQIILKSDTNPQKEDSDRGENKNG